MLEPAAVSAWHCSEPGDREKRVTGTPLTVPRENLWPNLSPGAEIGPSGAGLQKKPITLTLNWLGLGMHKKEEHTKTEGGAVSVKRLLISLGGSQ